MAERLLEVTDLSTHFFTHVGVVKAVNGVSFTLDRQETLGIVGESGSGKTVAALSVMRLIPDPPGKIVAGDISLKADADLGAALAAADEAGAELAARSDLRVDEPALALDGEHVVLHAGTEQAVKAAGDLLRDRLVKHGVPPVAATWGALQSVDGAGFEQRVRLGRTDIRSLTEEEMRGVRGNDIAMIFQDPMTSLNPVFKVGSQIAEAIMLHQDKEKSEAWEMAADLLARVGIPDARKRANQYPFEFSGGMRQRAMIAMAISCNPDILIADEPTTALDVTIQAQIIDVVREMQAQFHSGVILITHDLGVVAEIADKVMVMYGGRTVEYGAVDEIYYNPHHPYTWGLLGSLPRLDLAEKHRLEPIKGQPPDLLLLPAGCPFSGRCAFERPECRDGWPAHELVAPGHGVHCWIPVDERLEQRAGLPRFKEWVA